MEAAALPFAIMGLFFGLAALAQVIEMKKEVERLRSQLEGD